ncbi:NEDD8-activating enzyme E1 regulatory subunit [Colletotrichum shisoi]|uniref:NEDD8-activating enzyme E1 regulatory subunit n=1 Tax=Colletotrichum shisoi TaxID=2078593 RepID=A0A5Q4BKT9_9PEZI|nr:NEDD8-activating enzyme E1 regulatory subunit [Colletotrichum shisoi]
MTDIITSQAPPAISIPSEKEKKYDRQLRLWAASGQAALESASILLVNSGSGTVGVETLKNLVLPGIGKFTIADNATVSEADLGVNFFLDESHFGKSRAQSCTELLLELNPEVRGDWYPRNQRTWDLHRLLDSPGPFTVILYTLPMEPEDLNILESYSQEQNTPLVAIHSAGFYSYFSIRLPSVYPVVDTHPDATSTTDLRLLDPWEELEAFAEGMTRDIENLDNHDHGHLPFVVILLHYLKVWKASHDGAAPSNYKEKVEFRKMVADATRTDNPEGGEENFEEAVAAVLKTILPPSLPSAVKQVFEYTHANDSVAKSTFWVIADAVRDFYERHQCLPVPGGLPDMKAQSSVYIELQNIYKAKARKDAAEVLASVRQKPGGEGVDPAEVELFCKNAAFVKLVVPASGGTEQLRTVAEQEFANDEMAKEGVLPLSLLPVYLALRSRSHAGTASPDDILAKIQSLVPGTIDNERLAQAAQEVSRAGGGELHNVSAVTGGMVAQETIKIITNQYVPIESTCVFDGIASRCQILHL